MPASICYLRLILVSALCVTVPQVESAGKNARARYRNLYGTEDFNSTTVENLIGSSIGGANFLYQNEMFLREVPPDVTPADNSVYDFIVIGAGTAGATIASRLSEIEDFNVLLIEAGGDENLIMDIPILALFLQSTSSINWKYKTEPSDKYCTGMEGKMCNWYRGRVMGGSSVLNFMIATRGSPYDFDRWAELGNEGWAFKDVLKYFKKLESIQIPELMKDTKYHNTDGPVAISYANYYTPTAQAFLEAGQELGYPLVDYNGKEMIGFSHIQTTTKNGLRWSSNRAYLSGKRRRNLHISKMSLVNKILIDKKKKRAFGVIFTKNNRRIAVYVRREVILCAGAVGSPQLLMLSGIGPAKHLQDLGIDVIKNAPVGNNLMDHIAYGGLTFTVDQPVTLMMKDIMDLSNPYIKDYVLNQKGPLTTAGGCEIIGFIDVDNPNKRKGVPNMELLFLGATIYMDEILMDNFGLNKKVENMFQRLRDTYAWSVFPMLLRPKSRGTVRLRSKNVNDHPIIIPNYLDDKEDIRILVEGIKAAIRVSETKAMQRLGTKLFNVTLPGCEKYKYHSDDYWLCQLRTETFNIYHYSGTCKMGPRTDKTAVVDPRLKVIGVKGLRVADVSIMPEITSAHTNIPTYMIGEKLADMVKEDWGYSTD